MLWHNVRAAVDNLFTSGIIVFKEKQNIGVRTGAKRLRSIAGQFDKDVPWVTTLGALKNLFPQINGGRSPGPVKTPLKRPDANLFYVVTKAVANEMHKLIDAGRLLQGPGRALGSFQVTEIVTLMKPEAVFKYTMNRHIRIGPVDFLLEPLARLI